jgi:DNA-binding NtrC family response regulator
MAEVAGQALVVQVPRREHQDALTRALTGLGFAVAVVTDFDDARNRVTSEPPDLLVTHVRLGAVNGLHLVFAAKAVKPAVAAIVLGAAEDLPFSGEAERAGATFLLDPPSAVDLSAAIQRMRYSLGYNGAERRRVADRRQAIAGGDLHGRLEDKRRAIERERREFVRRLANGSDVARQPGSEGSPRGSADTD